MKQVGHAVKTKLASLTIFLVLAVTSTTETMKGVLSRLSWSEKTAVQQSPRQKRNLSRFACVILGHMEATYSVTYIWGKLTVKTTVCVRCKQKLKEENIKGRRIL